MPDHTTEIPERAVVIANEIFFGTLKKLRERGDLVQAEILERSSVTFGAATAPLREELEEAKAERDDRRSEAKSAADWARYSEKKARAVEGERNEAWSALLKATSEVPRREIDALASAISSAAQELANGAPRERVIASLGTTDEIVSAWAKRDLRKRADSAEHRLEEVKAENEKLIRVFNAAAATVFWAGDPERLRAKLKAQHEAIIAFNRPGATLQDSQVEEEGEKCNRCGRGCAIWFASSPLWNAVIRNGSIDGQPEFGDMVCATCFMQLAEEKGVATAFRVTAADIAVELETVTPSGRIWDEGAFRWRSEEPACVKCGGRGYLENHPPGPLTTPCPDCSTQEAGGDEQPVDDDCESCDDTGIYLEGEEWAPCMECQRGRNFAMVLTSVTSELRAERDSRLTKEQCLKHFARNAAFLQRLLDAAVEHRDRPWPSQRDEQCLLIEERIDAAFGDDR